MPWYERVDGPEILQGDLIASCPILRPPDDFPTEFKEQAGAPVRLTIVDAIVLSQSCDLRENKVELVLLCPHYSLEDFTTKHADFLPKKKKERLRQGLVIGSHLLNAGEAEGLKTGLRVVAFQQVFSLPLPYVQRLAAERGRRLRLAAPYREHLAQAFARFIMRVGLPEDIPPFK